MEAHDGGGWSIKTKIILTLVLVMMFVAHVLICELQEN